jgi:hypothetical protein
MIRKRNPVLRFSGAILLFLTLAGIYLANSGAPLRVHLLAIGCLAIAILIPTYVLAGQPRTLSDWTIASLLIVASMVVWDGFSWKVILKMEPFNMLRYSPLSYLLGFFLIGGLSLGAAQTVRWLVKHKMSDCLTESFQADRYPRERSSR